MTQYKVDVIGETCCDKTFDSIAESFDHLKHLLEDGKTVEISVVPEVPCEAPVEGEGAPKSTEPPVEEAPKEDAPEAPVEAPVEEAPAELPETPDTQDTDVTDEPATDPKDADIDATDDTDEDDDGELSGEEIDAGVDVEDEDKLDGI